MSIKTIDLEALIDDAGRDMVFAKARDAGWGEHEWPPKWVWQQIAIHLIVDRQKIMEQLR